MQTVACTCRHMEQKYTENGNAQCLYININLNWLGHDGLFTGQQIFFSRQVWSVIRGFITMINEWKEGTLKKWLLKTKWTLLASDWSLKSLKSCFFFLVVFPAMIKYYIISLLFILFVTVHHMANLLVNLYWDKKYSYSISDDPSSYH